MHRQMETSMPSIGGSPLLACPPERRFFGYCCSHRKDRRDDDRPFLLAAVRLSPDEPPTFDPTYFHHRHPVQCFQESPKSQKVRFAWILAFHPPPGFFSLMSVPSTPFSVQPPNPPIDTHSSQPTKHDSHAAARRVAPQPRGAGRWESGLRRPRCVRVDCCCSRLCSSLRG